MDLKPHTTGCQLDLTAGFNGLAVCLCNTWSAGLCTRHNIWSVEVKVCFKCTCLRIKFIILMNNYSFSLMDLNGFCLHSKLKELIFWGGSTDEADFNSPKLIMSGGSNIDFVGTGGKKWWQKPSADFISTTGASVQFRSPVSTKTFEVLS